jgi:DNA topoisomerase-3
MVQRALFTAQDPKSLRQAFAALKPNRELRPVYEAAVARQQADQIFNLSLTRTATKMLVARGTKGVIVIGRVKTPTLGIVCLRELEIRNFRIEDYFEIVATAEVAHGSFTMRHAPTAKQRIKDRARAELVAKAAANHVGPLGVTVEHRRQVPPRLFDLPSLQKTCGQRWGWNADRTLAVAQELYDGDGKKLITYPRAEARYLAENQIADVPAIVAALTGLRGFAHLLINPPAIRRGKSGHFSDKALEGVSHHAIVPNVNVLDDLEQRIARLNDDEKRLLALICRSYLAAVMPDYEYRQTVATMRVPLPGAEAVEFRAVGRIPLKLGWKAVYGATEPEPEKSKDGDTEAEQTLPQLANGERATLTDPRVDAKKTQPPPRYNEGTLVDAMQNAWRFVTDDALRERLKEAKGIGTPATRAEIIKGLKRQNMLTTDGKLVVPTPAGLQLFGLLKGAAPALVDPGMTAVWEMRLDEVVTGRLHFKGVIDEIAAEAGNLITVLRQYAGALVNLSQPAPTATRRGRTKARSKRNVDKASTRTSGTTGLKCEPRRSRKTKINAPKDGASTRASRASTSPPTTRMVAIAEKLAKDKKVGLPPGYARDFEICRRFLDDYAGR